MKKCAFYLVALVSVQGFGLMLAALVLGLANYAITGAAVGALAGLFSVWLQPKNDLQNKELGGLKW